ncbi:MAG TPA: hypothetical protein VFC76_08595 [Oscillospiraceae bacterium]|nr:hypothetical protein [Oscillospiraceae bacterium]
MRRFAEQTNESVAFGYRHLHQKKPQSGFFNEICLTASEIASL